MHIKIGRLAQIATALDELDEINLANKIDKIITRLAGASQPEIVELPIWRGINDSATIKSENGKLLLTSNLADGTVWFAQAWTRAGQDLATLHASKALVKIKIPFQFERLENGKIDLNSITPTQPEWVLHKHLNSLSVYHRGPLEIFPNDVEWRDTENIKQHQWGTRR